MSNMYSLLNYIAATSKDKYESSGSSQLLHHHLHPSRDEDVIELPEPGLRGLTEDEKRLVGISTISVVTRLALEFKLEEVLRPSKKHPFVLSSLGHQTDGFNAPSKIAIC